VNGRAHDTAPTIRTVATACIILSLVGACGDDGPTDIADTVPPAKTPDLKVVLQTDSSVALTWTAPGDDGTEGTASRYDLRFGTAWSSPRRPHVRQARRRVCGSALLHRRRPIASL
jgi:hypothetical protein